MHVKQLPQLARLAAGMPAYLRCRVAPEMARRQIADRLLRRHERFIEMMQRLIFERPESPYARLLNRARVGPDVLVRLVEQVGVEPTLEHLRDRGVYLTLDEMRGRIPIRRGDLVIELDARGLGNPLLGGGLPGRSSGTRSAGTEVAYTWPFLEEEAATECLLYEMHGVGSTPAAMWLPGPPGIAGLHNLLLHLKMGRPPARWFSHTPVPRWTSSPFSRMALTFLLSASRACRLPAPTPEHLPIDRALDAAHWLSAARDLHRIGSLKTYASSAVRVATAARDAGLDLSGCVIFAGGEPLTAERRRFIESTGLSVQPRYVTTESGLVAGACGRTEGDAPDAMHVYQDRLALIAGPRDAVVQGQHLRSLAFTSLSLHTPRVLLNAELGDFGVLTNRECLCVFGSLGMHQHVSHVASPEKLTGEGMNVAAIELHRIVGALVAVAGGSPDDYQLRTGHDGRGLSTITIVIHPSIAGIEDEPFLRQLWRHLEGAGPGANLAAQLWREAGAVGIAREAPRSTAGHKLLPLDQVP